MASVAKIVLSSGTITGNDTGDAKVLEQGQRDFIISLNVTAITGGTLAGNIEHSPDGGTTWVTLKALSGLSATGVEVIQIDGSSEPVLPHVRANLTYAGTTVTYSCNLHYDRYK